MALYDVAEVTPVLKELLADDGVIFISIDDNEGHTIYVC